MHDLKVPAHQVYSEHAPDKLQDLDVMMSQWQGEEEELLAQVRRYGVYSVMRAS